MRIAGQSGASASRTTGRRAARQRRLVLRLLLGSLLLVLLGSAAAAVATEGDVPLTDSPTATALAEDAPLGEAYREAFVGEDGIYDPERGIVTPDEVAFDIEVEAAHDGENIYVRYDFPTPLPAYYHDYFVYRDGEWVRAGRSPVGTEPHGLYEDRITMLVDDGSVKGFANQGGWLTCHEDLRDPFMYASVSDDDVEAHPVLGDVYGNSDQRKYIPQSRDPDEQWWSFGGWGAMHPDRTEEYEQRRENGVFLDLWHWRAHRSEPIGYSDNQYVFEHRNASPGTGPYRTNWDDDADQPAFMLDPDVEGAPALDWDLIQDQDYGWDDQGFVIAEDVNAVAFDPDHQWEEGDVIPRRLLQTPDGSRGAITADSELVRDGDSDGWRWQVELTRPLDTGEPTADKAFRPGRTYDAAIAVHRLATGSRWHFVTLPFSIGIDIPGDVTASRFDGERPDWDAIEPTTLTAMYPGQTNWQWLTSDEHPGASEVRDDSMSVLGCHDDEIGLAAANRAIEPGLAGVDAHVEEEAGMFGMVFDPTNAVLVFLVVGAGTVVGAVVLARRRQPSNIEQEGPA